MSALLPLTPAQSEQLALDLKVDDIADDAGDRAITPAEARQFSEAAQKAFEDGAVGEKSQAWLEPYRELREAGWPWRVAAYIAWASCPRDERWPSTQLELARTVLGLKSDRVIRKWRKNNPAIDGAVGVMQAKALFEHRAEVFQALVKSATTPDHKNHQDRKLFLEMTGDYTPRVDATLRPGKAKDLSEYSDAELAALELSLEGGDGRQ